MVFSFLFCICSVYAAGFTSLPGILPGLLTAFYQNLLKVTATFAIYAMFIAIGFITRIV